MLSAHMERVQSGAAASSRCCGSRLVNVPSLPTRAHGHTPCSVPALHSSCSSSSSSTGWGRRRTNEIVCGGLKKETKKLAQTLKAHRKRLETLLSAHADTATMQMVLSEISQLQSAVDSIRAVQKELKREARSSSSSSSSSESDSEDELDSSKQQGVSRGSMVVAAGSVCMQVEVPAVDQEHPDIIQQLPPPQQYSSTGRILVCQGKACMNKGGLQVLQAASHAAAGSPGIEVLPCKCLGKCKQGPAVRMRNEQPGCTLLTQVNPLEVPDAVDQLFG